MDKFGHIKWSASNERSGSTAQAKCYTCRFCKRGFSNVQALGGHMNIHRRDRARIRQFSEENQLSSDTIKTPTDHDPSNYPFEQKSTSWQSEVAKSSYSFNGKEDKHAMHRGKVSVHHEIQKLPLFVEEPEAASNIDDNLKVTSGCGSHSDHREKRAEKLDLELRLGPDPDRRDKSRFSTQEFFLR